MRPLANLLRKAGLLAQCIFPVPKPCAGLARSAQGRTRTPVLQCYNSRLKCQIGGPILSQASSSPLFHCSPLLPPLLQMSR